MILILFLITARSELLLGCCNVALYINVGSLVTVAAVDLGDISAVNGSFVILVVVLQCEYELGLSL